MYTSLCEIAEWLITYCNMIFYYVVYQESWSPPAFVIQPQPAESTCCCNDPSTWRHISCHIIPPIPHLTMIHVGMHACMGHLVIASAPRYDPLHATPPGISLALAIYIFVCKTVHTSVCPYMHAYKFQYSLNPMCMSAHANDYRNNQPATCLLSMQAFTITIQCIQSI